MDRKSFRVLAVFDKVKEMDMCWITACCLYARFDGISDPVFGGDQNDAPLDARSAIGHGPARGDTGGKVEGDQGFAKAGVAIKGGQFAEGDAFFPEPMELLRFDIGE